MFPSLLFKENFISQFFQELIFNFLFSYYRVFSIPDKLWYCALVTIGYMLSQKCLLSWMFPCEYKNICCCETLDSYKYMLQIYEMFY